jgi:hypothetical protein
LLEAVIEGDGDPNFPPTTETTIQEFDSRGNALSVRTEIDFSNRKKIVTSH